MDRFYNDLYEAARAAGKPQTADQVDSELSLSLGNGSYLTLPARSYGESESIADME
jgi:hypothetical protein